MKYSKYKVPIWCTQKYTRYTQYITTVNRHIHAHILVRTEGKERQQQQERLHGESKVQKEDVGKK